MNKTTKSAVESVLRFDPLDKAEKITGKSYKEDGLTSALGMSLQLENMQNKRSLLEFTGDTYFGIPWVDFKNMLPKMGFQILFTEPFLDEQGKPEEALCAWNEATGALLWVDTFRLSDNSNPKHPPRMNSGKVYFCWAPNDKNSYLSGCSSCFTNHQNSYHINYDIREGLKHTLNKADSQGSFIKPWPYLPFMWLLTYMDTTVESYNHAKITKSRLDKLPDNVKKTIGYFA